jgi:hypothetical protein
MCSSGAAAGGDGEGGGEGLVLLALYTAVLAAFAWAETTLLLQHCRGMRDGRSCGLQVSCERWRSLHQQPSGSRVLCIAAHSSLRMHTPTCLGVAGAHIRMLMQGQGCSCRSSQPPCDSPTGICLSWRGRWHLPVTCTGLMSTQGEPWPWRNMASRCRQQSGGSSPPQSPSAHTCGGKGRGIPVDSCMLGGQRSTGAGRAPQQPACCSPCSQPRHIHHRHHMTTTSSSHRVCVARLGRLWVYERWCQCRAPA